jgi:hypothetical protein
MTTMIVEDVAVAVVIALFAWLVPMRRNGIPGLGGRGRAPGLIGPGPGLGGRERGRHARGRPRVADPAVADPAVAGGTTTRPERVRPRPVPAIERIAPAGGGRDDGRDLERERRILAALDRTWDAGYADRVAAEMREGEGHR